MQNGEMFQANGTWYRYFTWTDPKGHRFQFTVRTTSTSDPWRDGVQLRSITTGK